MSKYRDLYSQNNNELYRQIDSDCWKLGYNFYNNEKFDEMNQIGALDDTIMSLNRFFGRGHDDKYWKIKGNPETEFIAHAFENYYKGNEQFQKMTPELYDDMIKLVDEILKSI
jgi:hypothetical protein